MNFRQIPLVVIAGPTGVGKTQLSIQLAQEFKGEIINGDSMQVYQGLDIGTGKISPSEMEGVPHHLLDILAVNQAYDANLFKDMARRIILDIYQRGKLPILVGGTGLYLEGLLYNLEFGHEGSHDPELRKTLEEEGERIGAKAMWDRLNSLDTEAAKKISYHNLRRTIRALEVIQTTGIKFSLQESHRNQASTFNEMLFVLNRPRHLLYERINSRVLDMVVEGLEDESYQLYQQSQGQEWQSTRGIGYKEWWPYFTNQITKESVIEQIQVNSRRYAKRQLTWFRNRMKDPIWLDMDNEEQAYHEIRRLINEGLIGIEGNE